MLCVLPILWAALLFSEAGWDFWTCCVPAVSPRQKEREQERECRGGEEGIGPKGDRKKCIYNILQKGRGRQEHDKSVWLKLQISLL